MYDMKLCNSGKTQEKCRVSRGCWKLMTRPGYQHYALTHQVFYTEIGTAVDKCTFIALYIYTPIYVIYIHGVFVVYPEDLFNVPLGGYTPKNNINFWHITFKHS